MSSEVIKDNIIQRIKDGIEENLIICTDWRTSDYEVISKELIQISMTFKTLSLIADKFADATKYRKLKDYDTADALINEASELYKTLPLYARFYFK